MLLDKTLNAKISDFCLAKLDEEEKDPYQHTNSWNNVSVLPYLLLLDSLYRNQFCLCI